MSGIFLFKMMFDRLGRKKRNGHLHPCPDEINRRAKNRIRLKRYIDSFFHIITVREKRPDDNK